MLYNQMDVWFADFKYEDNKSISEERPILILAAVGADFVKVLKGTTNTNTPMRRLIINHKAAGLNKQTAFFMNKVYLIKKSALLYKVGKLSFSDCVQVLDMLNVNVPIPTIVLESKSENHYISDKMSAFIEKNIDLIEFNDWDELFRQTFEEEFTEVNYTELGDILSEVLDVSPEILEEQRFKVAEYQFMDRVNWELDQANNDLFEKKNHHWDRFWYVMDAINLPEVEGYEFLNHLLKPDVQKRLNIKMELLEPEYGWYGEGDYSILGLFNKDTFEVEE